MGVLQQHAHLIIYCSAQRFQGDKKDLLSLCRRTAIDLLQGVLAWRDATRISNYFIGHVA